MSSEHVGYIVQINQLDKHPNAHSLQIATIFGASVIVDLNVKINDIGIYFPIDLQLSEEYCNQNNLTRKLDSEGNNIGGYLDPNKRNIRAIKLRGERSEGLFMPLDSLFYTGITSFEIGNKIDILNKHEICKKYLPHNGHIFAAAAKKGNKTRKKRASIAPLFAEHADTEQLTYNLNQFCPGDLIEITLKIHGTSARTGYLPVLKKYKRSLLDIILHREGKPVYDWGYISGTRRVVLENFQGGFYGDNSFREQYAKFFEGKLNKGETVYYEITSYLPDGTPIMGSCAVPKEYQIQYGKTMEFSYGCSPTGEQVKYGRDNNGHFALIQKVPQSDFYVYRMTMTNEDNDVVEYSPDFMRYRCEQMGAKCVPVFWQGFVPKSAVYPASQEDKELGYLSSGKEMPLGEWVQNKAEEYYDGPDPIDNSHVREGVVVRIVNRPKFCAFKHKNFLFKLITGIIKENQVSDKLTEDMLEEL